MKLIQIIPITILALVLASTLVYAAHTPQVLLNPSEIAASTSNDILLSVKNVNGDNIVKVELDVPLDSNQYPIYTILDVGTPAGWSVLKYTKKIVWTSVEGIKEGDSVEFGLIVMSPSSGQYEWKWITTDVNNQPFPGSSITKTSLSPASYFRISGAANSIMAGNMMKINVRVYGSDNTIKTDYTGTVNFVSTDAKAILPTAYTFTSSDKGSKDFFIAYKTIGAQTFTVADSKISQKSATTNVGLGTLTSLLITPDNAQTNPGKTVEYKAVAMDNFENRLDVTKSAKWSTDQAAGGSWNSSVYTAKNEGTWTVIGLYNSLADGTTLTVKSGVVTPVVNETEENETEPLEEMNIETQDSVTIAPGSNETFVVTVNNVGSEDLVDVSLSTASISNTWLTTYPSKITIGAGTSKDFLVVINVPNNTDQTSLKISLVATSSSGTKSTKDIDLEISNAPTGLMGLSKNLLNLGIVIVAVAALVLIAWELWFRKK